MDGDLRRALERAVGEVDGAPASRFEARRRAESAVTSATALLRSEGYYQPVVEDIVDTGYTLHHVLEILRTRHPRRIEVCALLDKPSRREVPIKATWTGFDIPDEFVVGYGIDFAQRNRNLPYIGKVRFTE